MHEEDERPPNENSNAYHFSITCKECERISSDKASNLPKRDVRFNLLK